MDTLIFREELTEFLNTSGVSQNALARGAEVPQSQISDWSREAPKRFGKNAKKVMRFIENYRKSDEESLPEEVVVAIRKFCVGDKGKYAFLVNMLETLHPLVNRV